MVTNNKSSKRLAKVQNLIASKFLPLDPNRRRCCNVPAQSGHNGGLVGPIPAVHTSKMKMSNMPVHVTYESSWEMMDPVKVSESDLGSHEVKLLLKVSKGTEKDPAEGFKGIKFYLVFIFPATSENYIATKQILFHATSNPGLLVSSSHKIDVLIKQVLY